MEYVFLATPCANRYNKGKGGAIAMPFVYKDWEDLTIRDDFMFKAVMKNAELCKSVLEAILSQPIRDIRYLSEELSLKAGYMSKGVRLDVYVEDEAHTVYDVEMQVRQEADDVCRNACAIIRRRWMWNS
jgi:hypothetical protein